MRKTYTLHVAGLERELPLCPVNEKMDIAAFIMFSDVELTIACAKALLEKLPEFDVIVTAEAKGIPLAYEMSRQSGKKYIPARKGPKLYMEKPVIVKDKSITTAAEQTLVIDQKDLDYMQGKRVVIADDVISTGGSLHALEALVSKCDCTVVARAAVLAEGKTELSGAATEPEIMDLVCVLQKMGAIISVDVDRTFRIEGVKELQGYTHTSLTDRIEAASWASAALATHGDIFVKGATQPEMITFLNVFRKVGGKFEVTDKGIRFWHPGGDLKPVAIETDVHPGFMTDWQQPLVVALTQANGLSIVHETVYENRFGFTKPLVEMGATIQLYRECLGSLPCRFRQRNYKHSAVIFGPTPLTGRDIDVPDLRGGFSHLIAALAASGPSDVHGISLIDRGYADFRGKLEALGADFD